MRKPVSESVLPFAWALLGTPLPPLNVAAALGCWLYWRLRRKPMACASFCLNVQFSYTLLFFLPIGAAFLMSAIERPGSGISLPSFVKLATGFPLGILSLGGILLLTFFNMRAVLGDISGAGRQDIPRIRFLPENG